MADYSFWRNRRKPFDRLPTENYRVNWGARHWVWPESFGRNLCCRFLNSGCHTVPRE